MATSIKATDQGVGSRRRATSSNLTGLQISNRKDKDGKGDGKNIEGESTYISSRADGEKSVGKGRVKSKFGGIQSDAGSNLEDDANTLS